MYYEIKDLDLIAKEFKHHDVCYREFTRKEDITHEKRKSLEDVRGAGNFEVVAKCVKEKILNENEAVSMTVLHELYRLHPEDGRYRGKLKARIRTAYPEKLLFLSLRQNTAEIVVSAEGVNSHYLLTIKIRLSNRQQTTLEMIYLIMPKVSQI